MHTEIAARLAEVSTQRYNRISVEIRTQSTGTGRCCCRIEEKLVDSQPLPLYNGIAPTSYHPAPLPLPFIFNIKLSGTSHFYHLTPNFAH
jgi:hypothetical protein